MNQLMLIFLLGTFCLLLVRLDRAGLAWIIVGFVCVLTVILALDNR